MSVMYQVQVIAIKVVQELYSYWWNINISPFFFDAVLKVNKIDSYANIKYYFMGESKECSRKKLNRSLRQFRIVMPS